MEEYFSDLCFCLAAVFRLPPGPLVGEDCNICWTEFEASFSLD